MSVPFRRWNYYWQRGGNYDNCPCGRPADAGYYCKLHADGAKPPAVKKEVRHQKEYARCKCGKIAMEGGSYCSEHNAK